MLMLGSKELTVSVRLLRSRASHIVRRKLFRRRKATGSAGSHERWRPHCTLYAVELKARADPPDRRCECARKVTAVFDDLNHLAAIGLRKSPGKVGSRQGDPLCSDAPARMEGLSWEMVSSKSITMRQARAPGSLSAKITFSWVRRSGSLAARYTLIETPKAEPWSDPQAWLGRKSSPAFADHRINRIDELYLWNCKA